MNQLEFLGLAHTFATVSPSNVQNIYIFFAKPAQKRYGFSSGDKKSYCCKGSAKILIQWLTTKLTILHEVVFITLSSYYDLDAYLPAN